METEDIIKKIYLFAEFSLPELREVAHVSKTVKLHKDEELFTEGKEASSFYVVKSGTLKVSTSTDSGLDVNIITVSEGDHLGEIPFLDGAKRSATVVAFEPSELLEIPYEALRVVLQKRPETELKFYKALSQNFVRRIRALTQDLTFARELRKKFVG